VPCRLVVPDLGRSDALPYGLPDGARYYFRFQGRESPLRSEAIVTKADIVHAVYTRLGGFSKKESADLVDLVFETMKETLGRGEKIKISGFGNFVLRDKRQRQGRNPQTGEPITITERRVLNFKASQLLKQALNGSEDGSPVGEAAAAKDA
jgi:integration host factor subunit alpha